MIIIENLMQGSAEWHRIKAGVISASQVDKLLTPTLKLSAQRRSLIYKIVAERILSEPVESFGGNFWTERALALEGEARDYFALQTGLNPRAVGFIFRDETRTCGCSPDWFMDVAGLELKCPKAETHVGYLLDGGAVKYSPQIQFSLWVTGLPSWWFLSYYPGLPPVLMQIAPEDEWQAAFDETIPSVLKEIEEAMMRITR